MAGLSKAIVIGNLGRDPEMRYMPSGSPVTSFSVAASRRWKSQDGTEHEETEWFKVSCFGRLAETANEYLQKGKQVYIEGRLHLGSWDDRQSGEKRYQMEIAATDFQMLGTRGEQGTDAPAERGERVSAMENSDFNDMPF